MYIVLFIHLLYKIPSTYPPILRKLETQKKKVKSCTRKDGRILGKGKTFISHVQETAKFKGEGTWTALTINLFRSGRDDRIELTTIYFGWCRENISNYQFLFLEFWRGSWHCSIFFVCAGLESKFIGIEKNSNHLKDRVKQRHSAQLQR